MTQTNTQATTTDILEELLYAQQMTVEMLSQVKKTLESNNTPLGFVKGGVRNNILYVGKDGGQSGFFYKEGTNNIPAASNTLRAKIKYARVNERLKPDGTPSNTIHVRLDLGDDGQVLLVTGNCVTNFSKGFILGLEKINQEYSPVDLTDHVIQITAQRNDEIAEQHSKYVTLFCNLAYYDNGSFNVVRTEWDKNKDEMYWVNKAKTVLNKLFPHSGNNGSSNTEDSNNNDALWTHLLAESDKVIDALNWSPDQARELLYDIFKKRSRQLLTLDELEGFVARLKQELEKN